MIKRLNEDIAHGLFTTAANVHMRAEQRPITFALAIDGTKPTSYVLVLSAQDAIEIEDFMKRRQMLTLETIQGEFEP